MKRRGSLFYKVLIIFLLLGTVPALLTSARLLLMNRAMLLAGGEDWQLPAGVTQEITQMLTGETLAYLSYTLIVVGLMAIFASGGLIGPIRNLRTSMERFRAGEADYRVVIRTGDEVEELSTSFHTMADELTILQRNLEEQVQERTAALEKKARQMKAAVEVGQLVASIHELDNLLSEVTRLISQYFGYYHVGILLVDRSGEYLELRASNSSGGQDILQRGLRLRVAQEGVIGSAAATRRAYVAQEVSKEYSFLFDPDLPHTRSEVALPLMVHGDVLGVLDVQSRKEKAFSEEDVRTLQLVADQVAIAIQNTRLLTETHAALEASRRAYGELSQEAWEQFLRTRPELGVICSIEDAIIPVQKDWDQDAQLAHRTGEMIYPGGPVVAIPIKLRGRVMGVVRLAKSDEGSWSRKEIQLMQGLTDQLSVALESARLYEETQRRAERERLAGEITAKIRASNNPQVILQTAVTELREALRVHRAQVLLQSDPGERTFEKGNGHE